MRSTDGALETSYLLLESCVTISGLHTAAAAAAAAAAAVAVAVAASAATPVMGGPSRSRSKGADDAQVLSLTMLCDSVAFLRLDVAVWAQSK